MEYNTIKEQINFEIAWRYKELKNIEKLYFSNLENRELRIGNSIRNTFENTPQSKYILRSSIPLIYAHWEGFFKKSIELLNSELDNIIIDFNKLNNLLLVHLTKDKHKEEYLNKDFKFSEMIVDTESNLSWKVIKKFFLRYGFDIKNILKHKVDIEKLLKIRNGISHGENAYHFEKFENVEIYIKATIRLMILIRNMIINCLIYKTYYKKN